VISDVVPDVKLSSSETNAFGNLHINFDTEAGKIILQTDAKDKNNKPIYEWTAHPGSGNVTETRRQADGAREQIIMKNDGLQAFNLDSYKSDLKQTEEQSKELKNTISTTELKPDEMTQEEWDEIEAQRDIAFKIMYFFIVFILATFGMLYAYFKMA
jgi:hypothetical protein